MKTIFFHFIFSSYVLLAISTIKNKVKIVHLSFHLKVIGIELGINLKKCANRSGYKVSFFHAKHPFNFKI